MVKKRRENCIDRLRNGQLRPGHTRPQLQKWWRIQTFKVVHLSDKILHGENGTL